MGEILDAVRAVIREEDSFEGCIMTRKLYDDFVVGVTYN